MSSADRLCAMQAALATAFDNVEPSRRVASPTAIVRVAAIIHGMRDPFARNKCAINFAEFLAERSALPVDEKILLELCGHDASVRC